ncbi:hypothetical protein [Leuconostoc falkenbergense]|uniref:hypothetical protein n=1 Tax=Leuconostoc falkenbergense TaxID=2766470 RepID=UPI001966FB4B|nr:hypothetical protein [Leuconostoc falkenbergense]QSB51619.1 hypothetical protein I6J31_00840 [Leuconostoc falkenbergense]
MSDKTIISVEFVLLATSMLRNREEKRINYELYDYFSFDIVSNVWVLLSSQKKFDQLPDTIGQTF